MKFLRKGAVAIDPKAFGAYGIDYTFSDQPQQEAELFTDDVAYVTIRGPLSHHAEWWFESYDEIVVRMREAFASSAKIVFVSGDTPGGDVSGCFDTARELRRLADESGKLFVWYVDGQTCSAGLALAMAADIIVVPEEGRFGSIGVIAEVHSIAAALKAQGEDVRLITSGERKADGHPCNEISEETEAAIQASVDYESEIFFQWVSERRGIDVETIRSWQAGIFHGQQAVDIGLADEVAGESAALAMVAGAELTDAPVGVDKDGDSMAAKSLAASARAALGLPAPKATVANRAEDDSFESIRKKLGKMAGENTDDARKARKVLDALDAEGEEDDKKDDEHKEPDGDEGSASASSAESDDDEDEASSSAEADDDASSSAESDDDAKKCEDEAKKAEADASEEDAKALAAVTSGEKNAAQVAKSHMLRSKSLRSSAARLRREAKAHRTVSAQNALLVNQAKAIDTLTKRVAKLGQPNPSVAAIGARGTPPTVPTNNQSASKVTVGGKVFDLSKFSAKERVAYGFEHPNQAIVEFEGEQHLGLIDPNEAKKLVDATREQVAKLNIGGPR